MDTRCVGQCLNFWESLCEMGSGASVPNSLKRYHQIEPRKKEPWFDDTVPNWGPGYPRLLRRADPGFLPLARRPSIFQWPGEIIRIISKFVVQLTHERFLRYRHTERKLHKSEANKTLSGDSYRRPGF